MGLACERFLHAAIRADWERERRRFRYNEADLMGNSDDASPNKMSSLGTKQGGNPRRAQLQAQLAAIKERLARMMAASKLNPNLQGAIQRLRVQQKQLAVELTRIDAAVSP